MNIKKKIIEFVRFRIEGLEDDRESDPSDIQEDIYNCQRLIDNIENDDLTYLQDLTNDEIEREIISEFEYMAWDHPADLRNFRKWLVKTGLAFVASDRIYSTRKLTFKVDGKDYEW